MKKVLLSLLCCASMLSAKEQEVVNFDRMNNMHLMEKALSTIQKGFLFDNIEVVKNGVRDLKASSLDTKSYLKEGLSRTGVNTIPYAKKQAADINALADEILATFEKGDRYTAANGYLKILSKCLTCHQDIRSW
jgi:cytochrome c556